MNRNSLKNMILAACLGFLVMECARPVSPTGGPKDDTPPQPAVQYPPNRTTEFNTGKITLSFDEFISLKDQAKEIFVSPPMKTKPLIKSRSKSILVEFQEDLLPNTTYTISFGNAIVDFTEGNPLTNYEYVFSTGTHIDSLSVSGKVLNAFNHQPEAEILVMLYRDNNDTLPIDSLPLHTPPVNASKSVKDGTFRINNLPPGEYLLFALQDLNNNFIFDLPNEKIAWLDTLLILNPQDFFAPEADSVVSADSSDQVLPDDRTISIADYTLLLFEEVDPTQKLLSKKLTPPNQLSYYFRMPADSLEFSLVSPYEALTDWYIPEYSIYKDTITLWLKPGLPDTIRVRMAASSSVTDTSRFILPKAEPDKPGKKKDGKSGQLKIATNTTGSSLDPNKDFRLIFPRPVLDYDTTRIILTSETDTINPPVQFTDSIHRICTVRHPWLEGESYRITLLDSAFIDMTGQYNDSTTFFIKVRKISDYGSLFLQVELPQDSIPFILQLMTEKEAVMRETIINKSGLLKFDLLMPGKYKIKAIHDRNGNGRWDTGNYRKNLLPERIEYYTPRITVRANWDLQEEWKIQIK